MSDRPEWCLDLSCEPHSKSPDTPPGGSQFCCGGTDVMVTERQGVEHVNDGHFCVKSPRGITMLEINANDLRLFIRLTGRSLINRDSSELFNPDWYLGRGSWVDLSSDLPDQERKET